MDEPKEHEKEVLINDEDLVTVTTMNHLIEIQAMDRMNMGPTIKKIDKDHYMILATGEIMEYDHISNRSDSYNSLRQTFKKIRYLINNNFTGQKNELFITLTYAENMSDTKKLYKDMDKFMKRVRYRYKTQSTIDYLSVIEPQGRGAWHVHLLLRFNSLKAVFIPSNELSELWGHGYVKIERIKDVDNIGAYLSAYLADIELSPDTLFKGLEEKRQLVEKEINGEKKKFIKGGRLHMYPPGINLYRKSKGIEFPERKKMAYKDIKKIVGSRQPHYSKKYKIDTEEYPVTVQFEQYNLKRL